MRLIDADALSVNLDGMMEVSPTGYIHGDTIADMIGDAPTIDPIRKGKWILVKGSNGKDYHKCSECLHTQEITGVKNYCAVCGADMGEGD